MAKRVRRIQAPKTRHLSDKNSRKFNFDFTGMERPRYTRKAKHVMEW